MEKRESVFFEVLLRNSHDIITEAMHQKDMQHANLMRKHSSDYTADTALDNITGGQMSIDLNGNLVRLRHLQQWADILLATEEHFRQLAENSDDKIHRSIYDIFRLSYQQAWPNRNAIKKLRVARPTFFAAKDEIKNYVRASACQLGLWKIFDRNSKNTCQNSDK